jgi:probable HAF family extracellular repeat protein
MVACMSTRTIVLSLCLALFFATAQAQTCTPIPTAYTLTDLGTLGGRFADAIAINSAGEVTGNSELATFGNYDAFLWTPTGGMQDLGNLGGSYSYGYAINSAGNVTGQAQVNLSTGAGHAFLWTSSTGMQDLGILNGNPESFSVGEGIDDQSRVVGWEDDPQGTRALLFANSRIFDLQRRSGESFFEANAINNKGQVVGEGLPDAVLWTKAKGLTHLGMLAHSTFSRAFGINPSGTIIAGDNDDQNSNFSALAWILDTSTGTYVINDLGAGSAFAANDGCQVVGNSGFFHAYVWTPSEGRVDLNTLIPPNSGLVLHYAFGINNAGQIVGTAKDAHGNDHAYLVTPVP